jgi:Fe-S-cluster-containing hydrogenase component 2
MDTTGIQQLLADNLEHPRWDDVASRCLTCANCTLVCPTCFCHGVEDTTDLTGDHAERWRHWDSCFTLDYSYVHGGTVRSSTRSRYRQWMTHKLGTWFDQYGTSGCVGCGRCTTWCPVGGGRPRSGARTAAGATRRLHGRGSRLHRGSGLTPAVEAGAREAARQLATEVATISEVHR